MTPVSYSTYLRSSHIDILISIWPTTHPKIWVGTTSHVLSLRQWSPLATSLIGSSALVHSKSTGIQSWSILISVNTSTRPMTPSSTSSDTKLWRMTCTASICGKKYGPTNTRTYCSDTVNQMVVCFPYIYSGDKSTFRIQRTYTAPTKNNFVSIELMSRGHVTFNSKLELGWVEIDLAEPWARFIFGHNLRLGKWLLKHDHLNTKAHIQNTQARTRKSR